MSTYGTDFLNLISLIDLGESVDCVYCGQFRDRTKDSAPRCVGWARRMLSLRELDASCEFHSSGMLLCPVVQCRLAGLRFFVIDTKSPFLNLISI